MARLSIGEFLAKLRKEKSLTQQEVADRLDVSNRTVSAWEKDKAMPDILLLPAIAELYGVSVDEILRGARNEGEDDAPVFSPKTEKYILNKKLSHFNMQVYILLGVSIVAQLFVFIGWFNDLFTVTAKGDFNWWKFVTYLSLAAVIVVLAVLIALWKSAESSVDTSSKGSNKFYLSLFKSVVVHFYASAGLTFALGFVLLILCGNGIALVTRCIVYLVVSVVWLLVGALLHNHKINTLAEGESLLKQSHAIMFLCVAAACLLALESFAALVFCSQYRSDSVLLEFISNTFSITITVENEVDTTAMLYLSSIISFALLLTGTLLFNSKLRAHAKEDKAFLVQMSGRMAVCFYVVAALYCALATFSIVAGSYNMWFNEVVVGLVLMYCYSVISLLLGALLHRRNLLLVWGGEEIHALFKRNGKLYLKVALWGLIPFAVAITLITVAYLVLGSLPLVFVGVAMVPLDIIVCFVICLVKREKPNFKQ